MIHSLKVAPTRKTIISLTQRHGIKHQSDSIFPPKIQNFLINWIKLKCKDKISFIHDNVWTFGRLLPSILNTSTQLWNINAVVPSWHPVSSILIITEQQNLRSTTEVYNLRSMLWNSDNTDTKYLSENVELRVKLKRAKQ